jgi:predicted dehydrogenase
MSELGVGVIGTGWVVGEHVRGFTNNPHTTVRAICGRSKAKAEAKAAERGISCDYYDDVAAMLDRDDIQIVTVATPPHVHKDHAVAAAKAGKHLFLEKAMANTLEDCQAIRDAVAEAGVKSVVSFVLRWNPLFDIIKKQIADGTVGNIFYGEVDYFHGIGPWYGQYAWNIKKEVGGSSLLSAGCHALDALRYFMGGNVAEVTQYATAGKGADFAAYEYNPTTVTILKFEDGRIGKVASCIECIQPYVFDIKLMGTGGSIHNNKFFSREAYPGQTDWTTVPTILPDSGDVTHHPFSGEADHLVDCIRNGVESHANVADAFITHEIVLAADQSGETGKPVSLPLG